MASSLHRVPCLDITSDNINQVWPRLLSSLSASHFVALDLELSGLGARDKLNAKLIDERYEAIADAARTRSILSIGIACFTFEHNNHNNQQIQQECHGEELAGTTSQDGNVINDKDGDDHSDEDNAVSHLASQSRYRDDIDIDTDWNADASQQKLSEWSYSCQLFNIMCLCDEHYVVEPDTLKFLVGHGFDFNKQCSIGVSYHKGNDDARDDCSLSSPSLRHLILHLVKNKLPIVVHNGFIDLIFMYQNFYSDLPKEMQTFLSDLSDMFKAGIFDTKYIADFHVKASRSYLEYLFYERQRFNLERILDGTSSLSIAFDLNLSNETENLQFRDLATKLYCSKNIVICNDYAYHGWCKQSNTCEKSHNIDHILDFKRRNKSKRMKKKVNQMKVLNESLSKVDGELVDEDVISKPNATKQGIHSAGYDAFMTGYCFAMFLATYSKNSPNPIDPINVKHLGIPNFINNLYLTSKDTPLRVAASSFAKQSVGHKSKMNKLKNI